MKVSPFIITYNNQIRAIVYVYVYECMLFEYYWISRYTIISIVRISRYDHLAMFSRYWLQLILFIVIECIIGGIFLGYIRVKESAEPQLMSFTTTPCTTTTIIMPNCSLPSTNNLDILDAPSRRFVVGMESAFMNYNGSVIDILIAVAPSFNYYAHGPWFDQNVDKECFGGRIHCVQSNTGTDYLKAQLVVENYWGSTATWNLKRLRKLPGKRVVAYENMERTDTWERDWKLIENGTHPLFDMALSYRLRHTDRHFPLSYIWPPIEKMREDALISIDVPKDPTLKPIAYVSRYCRQARDDIVRFLDAKIGVDSYGTCLHNKDYPEGQSRNKTFVMQRHKFCIAIDNSCDNVDYRRNGYWPDHLHEDYVTEKVYDCLYSAAVPIYFGPSHIYHLIPSNSAIVMGEFASLDELVNYLKFLMSNDTEYERYREWIYHDWPPALVDHFKNYGGHNLQCNLCKHTAYQLGLLNV